jgi:serine/threonine-protein kinase
LQLAIQALDQGSAVPLPGSENAGRPFFSPNGERIGFFADGKLKTIPVQGGSANTICDVPANWGASWAEDGNIILSAVAQGPLQSVSDHGGTPQPLTKLAPGEATHLWPQVLPGNKGVIFTANITSVGFEDATIQVWSRDTGEAKVLFRGGYFGRYVPAVGTKSSFGNLVYVHQGVLYRIPLDIDKMEVRGNPVPFLEDIGTDPINGFAQIDFSKAGMAVYVKGEKPVYSITQMDASGKKQPIISVPLGTYYTPRYSPDGKQLAFVKATKEGQDLWVHDFEGNGTHQLTFSHKVNRFFAWAPDGKHIAFGEQSTGALWWIRTDSGEAQILLEDKNILFPNSISHDGKHLAYFQITGDPGIWTLPLDIADSNHPKAGKPEAFIRGIYKFDPAFSPDGNLMAYRTEDAGRGKSM